MKIELVKEEELEEVHELIVYTIKKSFPAFYPPNSVNIVVEEFNLNKIKDRASWTHFYVAKIENKIVTCGAIGPYWGSKEESSLFNIFVHPDYQKQGIGKKIVQTLEQDEYFLRAKRIEIPASMVGIPFYKKLGYEHKNGWLNFEDGHFALEKFNNK